MYFVLREVFSSSHIPRRSCKAFIIKDLLKDALKLFHANKHPETPCVNLGKVIYRVQFFGLL